MAQIRLFKFDTDGFQVEHDPTADDITALSLAAGTGGISTGGPLDMGDNQISNVPTPTDPDHGVNKAYVDALAQGLDVHEGVVAKTTQGLGTQAALAGSGGTGVSTITTESFDVRIDGEAGWTTITFASEASMAAIAGAINTQYGDTIAVVDGNDIDLNGLIYGEISQVETQNVDALITTELGIQNNQDVSGTGYTAAGTGVGKTLTALSDTSAANTIDGVLLEVADRVLVSMQGGADATGHEDNGVYDVTSLGNDSGTSFVLTRVTDADEASTGEMAKSLYVFVSGGTTYENTGWSEVLDVSTMGTDPIQFGQFSGSPGFTYDQGLVKDVSSIQVELDTDADAATTGAGGGSSGLEFDVDSAAGQLRVRVSPTGGIDRLADGIGVDLDGTTLQLDAGGAGSGLSVKGVPAQFEINGNPVSANVTQTAMDVIYGGVASNADSYHTHDFAASGHTHAHSATTGQTADDHHAQSHAHNGADGSGTVAHSDTTGQGTDDHHAQAHALDGGDHTLSGATPGDVLTALTASTFGFTTPVADHSEFEATAGTGGVTKGDPVYISANGTVLPCDNTNNNTRKYCGVALETKAQTETVRIQQDGKLADLTVGGSPSGGDLVYLNTPNGLTVTLPTGTGTHRLAVGKVFDDTGSPDIVIEPQYLGKIG